MNRHPADLYPMRVNPLNFNKGDVVKKVITDSIKTPYVGIITSVIPSTNKIEVQWPQGMGMEDPWDLIKVNPIIHPPVVNEDKAYKTYQNELSQKYFEKIKPHRVLDEYVKEEIQPLLLHASDLYNEGLSKEQSFKILSSEYDNLRSVVEALQKVFKDEIDVKKEKDILVDGDKKHVSLKIAGNDEEGFRVCCVFGNEKKEIFFDNIREAIESFKGFEGILNSLENAYDNSSVVGNVVKKVAEIRKKSPLLSEKEK